MQVVKCVLHGIAHAARGNHLMESLSLSVVLTALDRLQDAGSLGRLNDLESENLEALKKELHGSIQKGIDFVASGKAGRSCSSFNAALCVVHFSYYHRHAWRADHC